MTHSNALREQLETRGREMLKNMAETEGVKALGSGVILHVLEHGPEGPGQGIRATKASVVSTHFHGTLADGTVFDSTLGGDPVKLPLVQVIPGLRDGVLAMHEGETAMVGIPPEQGYGPEGTPDGRVPGGSALFFKIQLLKVLTGEIGGSGLVGSDGKSPLKRKADGGSGLIL
jgi:FKBP-type peptidyl-prolyl cis-trans isomerase